MQSRVRIIVAVVILSLVIPAVPASAACEGGYSVPQEWDSTFRYYNSSGTVVGFEHYFCGGLYTSRGTLHGTWMEETEIECCSGQTTQHTIFYWCPTYNDWVEVDYVGDTSCS